MFTRFVSHPKELYFIILYVKRSNYYIIVKKLISAGTRVAPIEKHSLNFNRGAFTAKQINAAAIVCQGLFKAWLKNLLTQEVFEYLLFICRPHFN